MTSDDSADNPVAEALIERVKAEIEAREGDTLVNVNPHGPDSVAVVVEEVGQSRPVVYLVTFESAIDGDEQSLRWTYLGDYHEE